MQSKYLETNPTITIPQEIINEKKKLVIEDPRNAKIFGSFIYRFQKYPADVDILEEVHGNSLDDLITKFIRSIKRITRGITTSPDHYFSEFKCGVDERYDIKIGDMDNGRYIVDKNLMKNIKNLYVNGLFNDDEHSKLMNILNSGGLLDANCFDTVFSIIRNRYILRWKASEIMSGTKKVDKGFTIKLNEALRQKSLVKIDEIVIINGKFMEITNIYGMHYKDANNNDKEIYPISDIQVLPVEIEKLYYSNMYYSPFKMLKRIYSYCRFEYRSSGGDEYKEIIDRIVPILQGDLSLFYQIISQFKTMSLVMEKFGLKTIYNVNIQLDNSKHRLSGVLALNNQDILSYSSSINQIIFDNRVKSKKMMLDEFTEIMKKKLNELTIEKLIGINLNPPNDLLLPSLDTITHYLPDENFLTRKYIKTYNQTVVRTPDSNPHKDYEDFLKRLKKLPIFVGVTDDMKPYYEAREMIIRQLPFNPYK